MAITSIDIKIYKSLRLTDAADGGGAMSAEEVIDGDVNNLFPDVDELAEAAGATRWRKAFGACVSDNQDTLLNAYACVLQPPEDTHQEVTLFAAAGYAEVRSEMLTRFEAGAETDASWSVVATDSTAAVAAGYGAQVVATDPTIIYRIEAEPEDLPQVGELLVFRQGTDEERFLVLALAADETAGWSVCTLRKISGTPSFEGLGEAIYRGYLLPIGAQPLVSAGVNALAADVDAEVGYVTVDRIRAAVSLDVDEIEPDGRAFIFRPGCLVLIHSTMVEALPNPAVAGSTYALARSSLAYAWLTDANGTPVSTDHYTVSLADGEITMANPLDLSEYTQPLQVRHRIQTARQVTAISAADGLFRLYLLNPVPRDFLAADTYVSSLLQLGDQVAAASVPFDQAAWTGEWSDSVIGGGASAEYNAVNYPIEVSNAGAVSDRWRFQFSNSSDFSCYSEVRGLISAGNTGADFAPINPATGEPYFTLRAAGWGSGWQGGNVLRLNTAGAAPPLWLNRTTLPGGVTPDYDAAVIEFRGYTND